MKFCIVNTNNTTLWKTGHLVSIKPFSYPFDQVRLLARNILSFGLKKLLIGRSVSSDDLQTFIFYLQLIHSQLSTYKFNTQT